MAQDPNGGRPHVPRIQDEGWLVGKLLAHGRAPYKGDPKAGMSYFIRLRTWETEQGALRQREQADQAARPIDGRTPRTAPSFHDGGIVERWGTDLERAVLKSKSGVAVGKIIAAKIVSREPVVSENIPSSPRRATMNYRNLWEVETVQFVAQRHRFARAVNENFRSARQAGAVGREALALYFIHSGAERLAAARYANAEDREAFLARLKNFLEVSPQREALIAAAARRIDARKAAARLSGTAQPSRTVDRDREPLTR